MFEYIIIFLVGYAIGKTPFVVQYLNTRSENQELKKDIIILKEHLSNSKRGRILKRTVQGAVQDEKQP